MIGGHRPGSNGVDALLVGYYDETGLRFGGKVRAGFVPQLRREIFKALKPHHVDGCRSAGFGLLLSGFVEVVDRALVRSNRPDV